MTLLRRLWRLLFPPPTRDVSRLEPRPGQADAVDEVVDTEVRPLKPGHLRLTHRDRRLLPKRKPVVRLRKRKRLMGRDEAARLFGGTLRTRNREIRDLLPDEEQLRRYGLPLWRTEADLAAALDVSVRELRFFSIHRQKERVRHYVSFAIPKRSGGQRVILAPKRRLKRLQRALLRLLVDRLPVSEQAHGFRKGRSIRTGAEVHLGRRVLVQLDLADFFPSITYPRVRGLLIALGYGYPVAACLATLLTEALRQPVSVEGEVYQVPVGPRRCPQGAPTSPGVANALTLRLDRRLSGLARRLGFAYTRYADDLTFSGDDPSRVKALLRLARQVVRAEGFAVNEKKTRVSRSGGAQRVTGVTVNRVLGLSRRERRRLRAAIHRALAAPGGPPPGVLAELRGRLAYLGMLNPAQAEPLRRRLEDRGGK